MSISRGRLRRSSPANGRRNKHRQAAGQKSQFAAAWGDGKGSLSPRKSRRHRPLATRCMALGTGQAEAPRSTTRAGKPGAIGFLEGIGGLLATAAVRAWMGTLDFRACYENPAVDPAYRGCQGQRIYVFWHEYILFPLYLRGHCNLAMLLSRHRDADILARVARHMGFEYVRGSTRRGGIAALRELLRPLRQTNLTITPDGPRGPRRHMAPGAVFLASKLRLPLVAMGFGYDRPWRIQRAWDQFAIPRPWSRARAVVSGDLHIPAGLDRQGLEHFRCQVQTLLNRLCDEAESWACSGRRRPGEVVLRPGPKQDPPFPAG